MDSNLARAADRFLQNPGRHPGVRRPGRTPLPAGRVAGAGEALRTPPLGPEPRRKTPAACARMSFRLGQVLEERCLQVDRVIERYQEAARVWRQTSVRRSSSSAASTSLARRGARFSRWPSSRATSRCSRSSAPSSARRWGRSGTSAWADADAGRAVLRTGTRRRPRDTSRPCWGLAGTARGSR